MPHVCAHKPTRSEVQQSVTSSSRSHASSIIWPIVQLPHRRVREHDAHRQGLYPNLHPGSLEPVTPSPGTGAQGGRSFSDHPPMARGAWSHSVRNQRSATISENLMTAPQRAPWNKGKLIGPRPPLRQKHVWAIRTRLQIEQQVRDLALFDLAIDSKLRGCDLVAIRVMTLPPTGTPSSGRPCVKERPADRCGSS